MAPFLTFLFVAATDYARIFHASLIVDNCARNGAIYASNVFTNTQWQGTSGQIASAQAAAVAEGTGLSPALTAANVAVSNGKDADGNTVVIVTVTYPFNTISRFPGIPSQVNLVSNAQMRQAQ
jgi:hypothetical protein